MTRGRLVFIILFFGTILMSVTPFEDKACPPGFLRLNVPSPVCVYIGTAVAWAEALDICHQRMARLFSYNLDYSDPGKNINLKNFILDRGINMTWTGMNIQNGKLRLDGMDFYDRTLFLRSLRNGTELEWDTGQPTESGDCVAGRFHIIRQAIDNNGIGRKRRQTEQIADVGLKISLTKCEMKLPFLCIRRSLVPLDMQPLPICPLGSVGSYNLTRCYTLYSEAVTYHEAVKKCESRQQRLAKADSLFYKRIVITAGNYLARMKEIFDRSLMMWVDTQSNCTVLRGNLRLFWNCKQKNPYICEQPAVHEDIKVTLNVSGDFFQVRPLAKPEDFEVFLDTRFTIATYINCNVKGLNPYLHIVTFYHNGRRINEQLFTNGIRYMLFNIEVKLFDVLDVGYYWCEVFNLNSGQLVTSNRVFVRRRDMILHAGSVTVRQLFPLRLEDAIMFNLDLLDGQSSALNQMQQMWRNLFNGSYSVVPLRFRDNGTKFDFLIWRYSEEISQIGTSYLQQNLVEATEAAVQMFQRQRETQEVVYFIPGTSVVRNFDYCFAYNYTNEKTGEIVEVPDTMVGMSYQSSHLCIIDRQPTWAVKCEGKKMYGAYWGEFWTNDACDFSDLPASDISNSLKNLSQAAVNSSNVEDVMSEVLELTDKKTLRVLDIIYVTIIIDNVVTVPRLSTKVAEGTLEMYTRVLKADTRDSRDNDTLGYAANRFLESLDTLADRLEPPPSGFQRLTSKTFAMEVWDLTNPSVNDITIGLQFMWNDDQRAIVDDNLKSIFNRNELSTPKTESAILFSEPFIQQLVDEAGTGTVRLAMNVHQDPKMFKISAMSNNSDSYTLNSGVMAAKILVNGSSVRNLRGSNVTTIFLPEKELRTEFRDNRTVCGYWNYSMNNNRGGWETDGCYHERVEDGRDVCYCDHLTNFAVLLDFHGQEHLLEQHALALSIITIIGLSLSIAGLSLTILTFVVFKHLRRSKQQQTLFHLALAEVCSWIVFLAGINQTQDNTGCIAVAALLHYFILASFMWMLMEAVLHALLLVKVYGTSYSNYMLKTAIPAWVIPVIPVVVVLSIDYSLYRGGEKYCWMSLTPFYYAFAIPVGLIILANFILYIMTVVSICRKSKAIMQNKQPEHQRTLRNLKAAAFSFILLGLSWVFGYMAIFDARIVFQYVFTITCSLQGFLVFLIFTLRDDKVRESWKNLCCKNCRQEPVPSIS